MNHFKISQFFCPMAKNTLPHTHLVVNFKDFNYLKRITPIKLKFDENQFLYNVHQLQNWTISNDLSKLSRLIKFQNFNEAFSFMTSIAIIAEEMGHHPDWSNVYNQVKIDLNTHDVGGISIKDYIMAFAIDQVAIDVQFKSVEGISDIRKLNQTVIIEKWNHNYTNYDEIQKILKSKEGTV